MSRRRRNPSIQDTNTLLVWGGIAVAAFLIYKLFSGAKNVLVNAQSAAGSSLADAAQFVLGSGQASPGEVYTVTMPDGTVQTVAYSQLPNAATPLPSATTGMQIGTGNAIADALSQGASGGG
jgi:hypothetical protein